METHEIQQLHTEHPVGEASKTLSSNDLTSQSSPGPLHWMTGLDDHSTALLDPSWDALHPDQSPIRSNIIVALVGSDAIVERWTLMRESKFPLSPGKPSLTTEDLPQLIRPYVLVREVQEREIWDCCFGVAEVRTIATVDRRLRHCALDWPGTEKLAAVQLWCLVMGHICDSVQRLNDMYRLISNVIEARDAMNGQQLRALESSEGVAKETSGSRAHSSLLFAQGDFIIARVMLEMENMSRAVFSRNLTPSPTEYPTPEPWTKDEKLNMFGCEAIPIVSAGNVEL
ncbi:hypothetical protein LTR17_027513 [Elasticomyces elasticus]|nr:hypothetical protein LTR17_027513 [Elasticomyces elasticus]